MLSQQQNPHGDSWSLQQQTGIVEADTKPFSIRQYVLASRYKDIFLSWPFPMKYLQICLKHGINNVLPPLEPFNAATQALSKGVGLKCCQEYKGDCDSFDNKITVGQVEIIADESHFYLDEKDCTTSLIGNIRCKQEENNHYHLVSIANSDCVAPTNQCLTSIQSFHYHVDQGTKSPGHPKRLRCKRKLRKGKCKKRSMVDILAVAKHCTLEDLYRISRLNGYSIKSTENGGEGIALTAHIEQKCKSEIMEDYSNMELRKDGNAETKNSNLLTVI